MQGLVLNNCAAGMNNKFLMTSTKVLRSSSNSLMLALQTFILQMHTAMP